MSKQAWRVKAYGGPSQNVVFFFCPFGVRRWRLALPGLPIWRLRRAGFEVVCYDFARSVGAQGAEFSVRCNEQIGKDVRRRVRDLQKRSATSFAAFGISMGSAMAAHAAAKNPQISKLVLCAAYGDITEHILANAKRKRMVGVLARYYMNRSGGEAKMRALLDKLSPLCLVEDLRSKEVFLCLGRRDHLLHYRHSKRLYKALHALNTSLTYYEIPRGNHYFVGLYASLRAGRYLDFLKKQ